jgi:hypothetical protein
MELEGIVETKMQKRRGREPGDGLPKPGKRAIRGRRARPLPGLTRKLSELAAETVETAIREEACNAAEHERVRKLCMIASSGTFSMMLKNSTLLTEADKEFLRDLGYMPAKGAKEMA